MNYNQKYNKYKKKYLELINIIQLGGSKRIDNEIKNLSLDLYRNIVLSEDKTLLTFIRISDNATIRINFPLNYPFNKPLIFINDKLVNISNWSPVQTIINYLNFNKKVLILCHNYEVTGSFEPLILNDHWYGNFTSNLFSNLFSDYKLEGIPSFETVDTLPGGTYQDDAFSDKFINEHINDYDLIMVPDCSGPWYKLQDNNKSIEQQNINNQILINLCLNLTKMLNSCGIIQFSKFINELPCKIYEKSFNSFSDALQYNLEQNGFIVQIKNNETKSLIAQKN